MDRIDVLGERPERRAAFTGDLLSETKDEELERIVRLAASELEAPIALVTLVLDQIQFFKAQVGLPADLAAARGTHRDVSFCQLVVRDEEAITVTDAPTDPRLPQHFVKEYDIRAYLGIPIHVGETVIGSLCVLDTRSRTFSDEERDRLTELAALVDARVASLVERRRMVRAELTSLASGPALAELRDSLGHVHAGTRAGAPALAAIRSYLDLSAFMLEGGSVSGAAMLQSLDAARAALDETEDVIHGIESSADDCEDCLLAIEHLLTPSDATRLSDVLVAAQDLVRQRTRDVGGVPLPDLAFDPAIHTPRPFAVALLAAVLTNVADRIADGSPAEGIRLRLRDLGATAELTVSSASLPGAEAASIASHLADQLGDDPSISVTGADDGVLVAFSVLDGAPASR